MQQSFRLLSYSVASSPARAGILVDDRIYDAAPCVHPSAIVQPGVSVSDLLSDWRASRDALARYADLARKGAVSGIDLGAATLHSPILYPGTIYCAGANYRDHLEEMLKVRNQPVPPAEQDAAPWHFLRPNKSCVAGPGGHVRRPVDSNRLDWEAELAVVIGTPARDVEAEDALKHVAGYMVANDLSARDLARRSDKAASSPFYFDWTAHKGFDGACPMGPWITPAEDVSDPQALDIRLWVNGVIKQDSNTARMIFSVAEQIAHLSRRVTLHPGDVILTGTPAGVGTARNEFLQPGDNVRVQIEHLGYLETHID
ncbi:fumarylacetoacetate hydrolase family protein [Burkholderia lata]|uniref:5-oxopent-3-ene-1,2,5-tricarboxylate decarboxylase n=1 Tax=Burkholderia lata (strain ATCC 17760 / DSM 23089 / LMG 22485 / NCIMB 9086 / R18194 / 383) TaxID=482957 RepID=A0A6P2QC64_BURL3|nr:fumarylacetoacetate hydrolase family protein [Burkholderia lata]VWC16853.1 5-oxopent-3-ene-1,2,5-tricarboxylate decarboxylase [Burkholderia lata]